MTFNIRYDEPRDKENAWPNRKELVASMIRFHQADLVGVQEALERQMRDLEKLLPDYTWVGVGRADGKAGGEFSAIMTAKPVLAASKAQRSGCPRLLACRARAGMQLTLGW